MWRDKKTGRKIGIKRKTPHPFADKEGVGGKWEGWEVREEWCGEGSGRGKIGGVREVGGMDI